MDEQERSATRPARPRRRRKSPLQKFKEAYLPVIILGITIVLIVVFIAGSLSRRPDQPDTPKPGPSDSTQDKTLQSEVNRLLATAAGQAASYDYQAALATLDSFSGNANDFPALAAKRVEYQKIQQNLVTWNDPAKVLNLSVQTLIADPATAIENIHYGVEFNREHLSTGEFSKILQQLYDKGYVLVSLTDVFQTSTGADGRTVYTAGTIQLPANKKPLLLTQSDWNYYTYMVDGDEDGLADANGCGFASRLVLDSNGKPTAEMILHNGNTATGDYDLVPLLDTFVKNHPDFSYRGAKATLALTGYDGLFGYRTNPEAEEKLGTSTYNQQITSAKQIADALRKDGYTLACGTYGGIDYETAEATDIQADMQAWQTYVAPVIGSTDILVYAKDSDIVRNEPYSGSKYNVLYSAGMRLYLGGGYAPMVEITGEYTRHNRMVLNGSTLAYHPDWFSDLFNAATVLDTAIRGIVPM